MAQPGKPNSGIAGPVGECKSITLAWSSFLSFGSGSRLPDISLH